ncbi:17045_t:CDS:2, partial [Racocetra fulgida]
ASTDTTRTWRRSSAINTPIITSPPVNIPTAAASITHTPTTSNITSPTTNQEPTSSYEPFLPTSEGNVKKCSVCCEDYSTVQQISSACGHNDLCPTCIKRHIEAELNTKGSEIQVRDISFKESFNPRKLLNAYIKIRYDTLLLRAAIRKLPDFRWCKAPKCGSGQEHTTGACGEKSCFTHDVPWHSGLTCDEFSEQLQTKDYTANRAYYERHTKPCPRCKMSIEKNHGCDHMTCRCGYEFCWL